MTFGGSLIRNARLAASQRDVMHFAAQAQRFVRSADCCAVPLGLAFGESCFWGVGCGRAIGNLRFRVWHGISVFVTSLS